MLAAFIPPCLFSLVGVANKKFAIYFRFNILDYTVAYYGISTFVLQIAGLIYYSRVAFDFTLWICGFFASIANLSGAAFLISAYATGDPLGPTSALCNIQTIFLTVLYALISMEMPNWIQILGLILGILGALTLSIPT